MKKILYASVNSSNLKEVNYDALTQKLRVRFHNGSEYCYHKVPQKVYTGLIRAESVGTYFNNYIRTIYSYEKI